MRLLKKQRTDKQSGRRQRIGINFSQPPACNSRWHRFPVVVILVDDTVTIDGNGSLDSNDTEDDGILIIVDRSVSDTGWIGCY